MPSRRTFLVVLFALVFPVLCLAAGPARIAILYGTEGRTPGDQRYNQALAGYLSRWIEECGLVAESFAETNATAALASPCEVAWILGVNTPSKKTLSSVGAYVKRGGKLLVVNSLSPELNAHVGAAPVGFRAAPGFAMWTGMRTTREKLPLGMPTELPMVINAITECKPVPKGGASVLARIATSQGKPTAYAALLSHPNGFCLTTPLNGSASPAARRIFLLSLMGHCAPSLWKSAADELARRLKLPTLLRELPAQKAPENAAVHALALSLASKASSDLEARRTMGATTALLALQTQLHRLQASSRPRWDSAICAVWDQQGYGFAPNQWEATCASLRAAGITDLILLTATPTWTHATVPGLTSSPLRKAHGDQLAAAVAAAHAHGLRIHAWISAFGLMNPTPSELQSLHAAGRLLVDASQQPLPFLNPRVPANNARLLETALHLARTYSIDGIHLDYIRYASTLETPTLAERAPFEAAMHCKASVWPRDVLRDGPLHEKFLTYRRYAIGGTVQSLRNQLRAAKPTLQLTAAVYGNPTKSALNVGQDWLSWLSHDYIDYAYPMSYATEPGFSNILDSQRCSRKIRKRIISGIGVTAAECNLTPPQILNQMHTLQTRHYGGFALFDLDSTLHDDVLPILAP